MSKQIIQQNADKKTAVIVDYKAIGCKSPGDNVQQIRDFVEQFMKTENVTTSMSIQVHSSENNISTGDCLRDLDSKALIKTDFVIMDVGCCGNLPLGELLDAHKALKKRDKNVILTSIVRNLYSKNPAEIGEFPIYAIDPNSGLLLHYVAGRVSENETDKSTGRPSSRYVEVPSRIFLDRESVKIYTNLCSTNLSIYSVNVPALFTELFDSHSEAELIQAAFDNHEVLGGTVYVNVVDDLFSQRMADFGFVINQKWDQFDTNLIYKRNNRCQVLRKLVNDSLIDCTRLNSLDYLENLDDNEDSEVESESESEESMMDDEEAFLFEVLDSLVRGFEETIESENLVLEVNSSKHAYNIGIDYVYSTIAKAILMLPEKLTSGKPNNTSEYSRLVQESIIKFKQFLSNYIKNDDSRKTVIIAMEEAYLSTQIELLTDTVLAKAFYKLYEIDILDEDSITDWFHNYDEDDELHELQKNLREKPALKQLIQALEAESEEDD